MASSLQQSLADGDPAAFAELYDRLAQRLLRTARTLIDSAPEAEDLVHDLFVELARIRRRLADVEQLDAYLFTMLRHAAGRRRQRLGVERRAIDRIVTERRSSDAAAPTAATPMLPDDELAQAVARLPGEQREVLALKIDGGLTFAEIAEVLGIGANTAASRYRYALEKLRGSLACEKESIR